MNLMIRAIVEGSPKRARQLMLSLMAALPIASCAIFQGAKALPDMTEDEAVAYGDYLGAQIGAIATQAVRDGEMSMDSLMNVALAFEAIGMGKVPPQASTLFDSSTVGAAILQLTINDIQYQLQLRGGFPNGGIAANAQLVCMEIAVGLKNAYKQLALEQNQ